MNKRGYDILENPLFYNFADCFYGDRHVSNFCDLVSRCHEFIDDVHLFYAGYLISFNPVFYEMMKMYINCDGIDFTSILEQYQHYEDKRFVQLINLLQDIYEIRKNISKR